jgi:hypothetical protein
MNSGDSLKLTVLLVSDEIESSGLKATGAPTGVTSKVIFASVLVSFFLICWMVALVIAFVLTTMYRGFLKPFLLRYLTMDGSLTMLSTYSGVGYASRVSIVSNL